MDLQISVFLLFVLISAGHSLRCYQCAGSSCTQTTCSTGVSSCIASTGYYSGIKTTYKGCYDFTNCPTGSINLGITKSSSYCCSSDLCNAQDSADPNTNVPNGKKCYYCDGQDCSKTLSCSVTEDRCISESGNIGNQSLIFKGCISNSFCNITGSISFLANSTCCSGNLCNGAKSVTQSLSFLCYFLPSFILMLCIHI
ncbi:phospholipase A2 inhibitor and Ly6/PLAUR domain-containing protein-like [Danio aesculapii]|uniref:phospholipase A2 inhibitor and Ly6/PLAUR domain-containing protein-like n=1 Tax=Danio aesculapii TaxID=1142201 RepID=UPI0024C07467|nr:phospholipase A2 inhibitor and Ly6/PLAUR domain-containing protein-like [Danio aesculapii]